LFLILVFHFFDKRVGILCIFGSIYLKTKIVDLIPNIDKPSLQKLLIRIGETYEEVQTLDDYSYESIDKYVNPENSISTELMMDLAHILRNSIQIK